MDCVFITIISILPIISGTIQTPTTTNTMSWQASDVPNPKTNPSACGVTYLTKAGYVCDPNFLVTNNTVIAMERMISLAYNNSRGVCKEDGDEGYRMAVVLLHDLYNTNGLSASQQRAVANNFALTLRNDSWRYGTCENDVTIVVSRMGNTIGVSVGNKVGSLLPSEMIKEIIDEAITRLNERTIGVETLWILSEFYEHLTGAVERWKTYRLIIFGVAAVLGAALVLLFLYIVAYSFVYLSTAQRKHRAKKALRKSNAAYDPEYGRKRWKKK